MSMFLNLVKLDDDNAERLGADEAALEALFFSEGGGGEAGPRGIDLAKDMFGTDYRTLDAIAEALEIDINKGSWLARSCGAAPATPIEYEFCYGPGFRIEARDVALIAKGFAQEPWYAETIEIDDDENLPGLVRFFEAAAAEHKAIIGGVS